MLRKTILIIFTIIMPGLLLLTACSDDTGSPDQQIRQLLADMESAVQQRSLDQVKALVSADYNDQWNGSRSAALRSLMFYFQGHQSIHLLTRVSAIELAEDQQQARVIVYVGMAGNPVENAQQLLAINADIYRFEIDLVADGKEWLVSHARWQRARLEDFGL